METRPTQHPTQPPDAGGPHALVSGGGSGGHVFPGLAIAEELTRRGWRVSWAGSGVGIESRLTAERRIPFHDLPARPVVGKGPAAKARAVALLARSAWSARSLVRRTRARIVVGTGGYASAPAVVGARLASRPALLVEPNADAGAANRWLSRLAAEAAVAFDETRAQLRCPARTTGVPVREAFFAAAAELPPAPPWRLLVLGGSQGARQINELMPRALAALPAELGAITVTHQTGDRHQEATREAYLAADLAELDAGARIEEGTGRPAAGRPAPRFEVVRFLDDMAGAMARSHLIVSRAGAITLAEICASGRPSLLVPLALAAGHQAANAQRLADAGAAEVLPAAADDTDVLADLTRILGTLLADAGRLAAMAGAARRLRHRGAAAAIADRVEHLGGRAIPGEEAS